MDNALINALLYALLPLGAIMIGGAVGIFFPPGPALRSGILHFAAGVVFSVVSVELLPDIVRLHAPLEIVLGFGLGIVAMLAVRYLSQKLDAHPPAGGGEAAEALPLGLLTAMGVDLLVDGFLLGIGFAAGAKEGVLLTLALTTEVFSLGLAVAVTLGKSRATRTKTLLILGGLGVTFLVGAAIGTALLGGASGNLLEIILSFGLAALLFLVTEELLTEAHEEPESPLLTASFFGGFLLFLLLGMLA
ncbi:ZIP family metal transporter [Pontibacter chitinilyticus]|uniref:ZIP family metal transporter n=1 Tax=Pontibacter chitinilyticus TaxID=2674989 RepID=UPI00321B0DAA